MTLLTRSICQGQTFSVGTHTYSVSGTYHDTLQSAAGCDSVVTLNLTVIQRIINPISRTICQGQSIIVGTHTYTAAGIYSDTLQSGAGCDSIVRLTLTVNPVKNTNLNRTICQGQSVVVGTHTYTQAGNFTDTLKTSGGCDSIVRLALIVNPKKTTSRAQTICQGQSITIGTHTYTQAGNYSDTLRTSLGCDSIVSLTLSVTSKIVNSLSKTICEGQTFTVGTHTYSQSGNYSDSLTAAGGCDSIVNLVLTVVPRTTVAVSRTICAGQSITVGTHTYTTAGNYTDTIASSIGCDSIVQLSLAVHPVQTSSLARTICEGQSVAIGTHVHTQNGTYIDTLISSNGCDSIVTLTLTVNPKKLTTLDRTICEGQSITVGAHTYTQAGTYNDTLVSAQTCDSIVTLQLTVNPIKTTNLKQSICTGSTFTVGAQTFDSTGNFSVLLQTSTGCDSTVLLDLTVTDSIVVDMSSTICNGSTFTIGPSTFNASGDYTVYLQAAAGCDSTVNLHLTVLDSIVTNIPLTVCDGDSVSFANQYFSQTGEYTVSFLSVLGCDSIFRIHVTVLPNTSSSISRIICPGESVTIAGQTFDAAGSYQIPLQNSLGCDSTINLDVTVAPNPVIDATADKTKAKAGEEIQLGVTTSGTLTYSWTPASQLDNASIQNPKGTIDAPTWFAVVATDISSNCKATDSVFVDLELEACSKDNVYVPNAFTPNGDGINDVFMVRSKILQSMTLIVTNRWGNTVFKGENISGGWDGMYKGEPAEPGTYGFYFSGVCIGGESLTIKGSITLLR
jgi:gliding motility-associated-like protein